MYCWSETVKGGGGLGFGQITTTIIKSAHVQFVERAGDKEIRLERDLQFHRQPLTTPPA